MAPRLLNEAPDASLCVKCRARPPLEPGLAFCSICFQETLEGKFKRDYSSVRDASHKRTGLVAYSGGTNSRAVLDLVLEFEKREAAIRAARDGRWRGEDKTVLHAVDVVHVVEDDRSGVPPPTTGLLPVRLLQLQDALDASSPLVDLLDPSLTLRVSGDGERPSWHDLWRSLSPSSSVTLRSLLRQRVLERYAHQQGHSVVVYGDNATRMAAKALATIATGRAWAMGELMAPFVHHRQGHLIVRPLHSISDKDISTYVALRGLGSSPAPPADPPPNDSSHVVGITDAFVRNLTNGFPATVSTVGKTVNKLDSRSKSSSFIPHCPLCQLPADPEAQRWRTTHSIVSLAPSQLNSGSRDGAESEEIPLAPLLCYACLVMLQDIPRVGAGERKRLIPLPTFVYEDALEELERRRMEAQSRSGLQGAR